jgi:hypothetical protein
LFADRALRLSISLDFSSTVKVPVVAARTVPWSPLLTQAGVDIGVTDLIALL